MAVCVEALPSFSSRPGAYALVLSPRRTETIRIGRLGELQVQSGFYVYVGSALGPGGIRARLNHHLHPSERPHWHIDYVRPHTTVEQVWFCYDRTLREHEWARCFAGMRSSSVPMVGFGSSDCDCQSRLFFFPSRPSRTAFARSIRSAGCRHVRDEGCSSLLCM
jgi:Uri superfamily endonuclease